MSGFYYSVFVLAILVIIWWHIENERDGPNSEGSKGFLAIKAPPNNNKASVKSDDRKSLLPRSGPQKPDSQPER